MAPAARASQTDVVVVTRRPQPCLGGMRAPMIQKIGRKMPMMNITQWPLRIETISEGHQQHEIDRAQQYDSGG